MINKALVKFYKCLYLKYLWKYTEKDAKNDELRMAILNIKAELDNPRNHILDHTDEDVYIRLETAKFIVDMYTKEPLK